MKKRVAKRIVTNAAAATSTGTARGRVSIPSARLFVGLFLVFQPSTNAQPSSYGSNAFSAYGYVRDSKGNRYLATVNPFNNDGIGSQAAPDGIEGTFSFDEVEVVHAFAGASLPAGEWLLVATAEPAPGVTMCPEEFDVLANEFDVFIDTLGSAT